MSGVDYTVLEAKHQIDGAPDIVRLPKKVKPEDITIDDLRHLSDDSFTLWTQTSGVEIDGNKIDFDKHRYLLPIYMCSDLEIVWRKAAQLGATSYMLLRLIHWLHTHQGRKAGLYFPTKEGVENLSKDRLTPIMESIPELNGTIDPNDKLGLRKIGKSSLYLFHLGGVASKDSVPLDFISFDEVRLCKPSEIDQAQYRVQHSPYKQKIFMSTCFIGSTQVFVREKATGHVYQRTIESLLNSYAEYEVLSYNRLGGYRPRWRNIKAVHDNGIRPVSDVILEGGHKITCTEDHRFATHSSDAPLFGERGFKAIADVKRYPNAAHSHGDELLYALKQLPTVEGNAYDLQTNEFFGLYVAEGTFHNNTVSIWQSAEGAKHIAVRDLAKSWAADNALAFRENDDGVHISGISTRPDLVRVLDACGGSAPEKRIPECLLTANEAQARHLLHGFILGDGHIYEGETLSSKTYDLYTTSRGLADDLQLLCYKLGCPASRSERWRSEKPVVIDGMQTGITNHPEIKLSINPGGHRHAELLRGMGGLEVRKILKAGNCRVFDLTVEEDSWYFIAGSGVLAHNCGLPDTDIDARFQMGTQHIWMSKCFVGETKLWVRDKTTGQVSVREIRDLGNFSQLQVLSVDTQHKKQVWRDITAVHYNGVKEVNTLLYGNGTSVTCTPDHRFAWVSRKKSDSISYVEAKDILGTYRNGKYNRNNLLTISKVGANTYPDIQAPWDNLTLAVVGAFIAEGSWKTATSINIAQLEGKHLHDLVKHWADSNNLTRNATSTGVDVSLASRPDLIDLFNQCGRGCENKQLPTFALSTQQAQYVLDGYLSGDGCRHAIDILHRHIPRRLSLLLDTPWEATTTSRKLAEQLQHLALRAGYYTSLRANPVRENKKPSWTISYHENSTRIHMRLNDELHTTSVVSCTSAGTAQVYDITVDAIEDRDHNFVLANGAVVHNCGCPDGCDLAKSFPDCVVDDKKRGKLYLRCPKCKYVINDAQNGRYVSHNPGADYTSFAVSALVSKYVPLKDLWTTYNRTTNKAEFMNASLGLPFIDEENRGVTKSQMDACVDPALSWASPGTTSNMAMGVDVGGGYCYVVIADLNDSKKRIRHVEIIESDNPAYQEAGKKVSPFKRLRQLMKDYKIQICCIDAMPNYDMVLEFAQEFPGKVFACFYAKEAKDIVTWSDKPKTKLTLKKAGPLLKFKHYCILSRYLSMDFALGEWAKTHVICPDPDRLVQMAYNEKSRLLEPEAVMRRMQSMLMRLVKRFHVTNDETGEGRHEWIYAGGDPHFAHAWNYCNIALERLRRGTIFTFA